MKKLFLSALLVPVMALAQTFPSPTFNILTLQTPLEVSGGGTGSATSTGSGAAVLSNSPALVTPNLGTPSAVTLTNGTGLPVAGLSGLGTGVATALGAAVTGSGSPVLGTAPTISNPTLTGTATGSAITALVSPFAPTLATISALNAATSTTLPQSQVIVSGFSTAGDAGAGVFNLGASTTANGCTIFNDASGRSWYRQTDGARINVRWCGAVGNGSTNDTAAFVNALAINKSVFVPDGNYIAADNSLVLHSGQSFTGAGRSTFLSSSYSGSGTLITCATRSGNPCITIPASQNWITVENMTVAGSGTLGSIPSGDHGIVFKGDCNYCKVIGVELYNHNDGLVLAGSTYGWIQNVVSENNSSAGVLEENTTSTPLQWTFNNVLSQFNGGQGFLIESQAASGATQMTLGLMDGLATFSNSGVGIGVVGTTGVPIFDIRIQNGFFGQDGNSEIFLQPFGGNVLLTGNSIELSGTGLTGPNGTTAVSNTGYGVQVLNGSNNKITGNWINANSQGGISYTGTFGNIASNNITNNGQNGTSATAIGLIVNAGGTVDVTGNSIANTGSGTTQLFGINNAGTINVSIGNNLKPNATGTYAGTAATIGGATLNNQ